VGPLVDESASLQTKLNRKGSLPTAVSNGLVSAQAMLFGALDLYDDSILYDDRHNAVAQSLKRLDDLRNDRVSNRIDVLAACIRVSI
jgi:hypothetical protein